MMNFTRLLVAVTLAVVPLGAQQTLPAWLPSQELWNRISEKDVLRGFQWAEVSTNIVRRRVEFEWSATAYSGSTPYYLLSPATAALHPHSNSVQKFGVRYWPYEVCVVSDTQILVGGVTDAGSTVIEKWTLGWPLAMPAPITSTQTGVTSVAIAAPSQSSVDVLYNSTVSGKYVVRNMSRIARPSGPITQALVQFDDSGDVYVMDLANGQLTLLASATDGSGALGLVPGLAKKRRSMFWWEHVSEGYVYIMREFIPGPDFGTADYLVLKDADKNGTIDGSVLLTASQWSAAGWDDASNYVGMSHE